MYHNSALPASSCATREEHTKEPVVREGKCADVNGRRTSAIYVQRK